MLIAAFGVPLTYGIDLATFLVSLGFLALMRASPPPADADAPSLRSIAEGLRYAGSRPELLGTYLVDINAMLFGMPQALFPAIAAATAAPRCWGCCSPRPRSARWSSRCSAAGREHVHRHGRAVALAACGWGVAIVAFGFADVLWLALACLAVAGAMDAISGLFRSVIWNETIPDRLRGRLAGVEMISYTSGPTLGNFEAGALASLTSVRTSVVSGGVLCVAGTVVLVALLPASGATTPASAPCRRRGERRRGRPPAPVRRRARRVPRMPAGTTSEPRSLPVRASSTISSSPCACVSAEEGVQAVRLGDHGHEAARGRHRRALAGEPARPEVPAGGGVHRGEPLPERRTRTRSPAIVTGGAPAAGRLRRCARPVRRSTVSTRATDAT